MWGKKKVHVQEGNCALFFLKNQLCSIAMLVWTAFVNENNLILCVSMVPYYYGLVQND